MNGHLHDYQKIIIKIGSSLLVDDQFELREEWLRSLATDVAALIKNGCKVVLVSSGAIALGRQQIHRFNPRIAKSQLELRESQAAAAVGQISLSSAYNAAFSEHALTTSQILLTIGDTEVRRRFLNARATIATLLDWGIIPIVNENDSVATTEICYGDNDRLSARVASMMDADLLILLSDVAGLYSAPPAEDSNARLIEKVEQIDDQILAMAGNAASDVSNGGMKTKIEAARIATEAGVTMVIASGKEHHAIEQLTKAGRGTWFIPQTNSLNARKKWIAGGLNLSGQVIIDAGALIALQSGKSLLPAGVTNCSGEFGRGDTIAIIGPNGHCLGRGLVEYDADDAERIIGLQSSEIRNILGHDIRTEMIHRDNLVLDTNEQI